MKTTIKTPGRPCWNDRVLILAAVLSTLARRPARVSPTGCIGTTFDLTADDSRALLERFGLDPETGEKRA